MKFKTFGLKTNKKIVMLHGGGLSWWSLRPIAEILKEKYYVVIPIIDGHGEDSSTDFVSIEDSAEKLIDYIYRELGGEIYLITGLSIGAQIVCEVLGRRKKIAQNAILESGLVIPIKKIGKIIELSASLSHKLVKYRIFSAFQAKTLSLPSCMLEDYYQDSLKMSKNSLINMMIRSNLSYKMPESISNSEAKILIICGSKEPKIILKSAELISKTVNGSQKYLIEGMGHGEISLKNSSYYLEILDNFIPELSN
jgi:pimeloyl-ACP methyl ester carboxylesterase